MLSVNAGVAPSYPMNWEKCRAGPGTRYPRPTLPGLLSMNSWLEGSRPDAGDGSNLSVKDKTCSF